MTRLGDNGTLFNNETGSALTREAGDVSDSLALFVFDNFLRNWTEKRVARLLDSSRVLSVCW